MSHSVGGLWALGVFLILYKGFTTQEDCALNIAGLSAILVAVFPENYDYGKGFLYTDLYKHIGIAHIFFAFLLFSCMFYVAWACADDTFDLLPDDQQEVWKNVYGPIYKVLGVCMFLVPIVALAVLYWYSEWKYLTLAVEWVGVWLFAAYWLLKSHELRKSKIELKAIERAGQNIS